jgi:enoyl-CoA hydratase/carnithine racemase
MGYEFIEVDKKNHITTITINRPEVMNCLSPMVSREMSSVINEFDDDPDQWIGVITGAGDRAFSAGNDLKWHSSHTKEEMAEAGKGIKGGFGGITARFDCYKPFIAAVNGLALGGGFEIALACDIIIAVEDAYFGLPEPRVGLWPGAGGVYRLSRQIPYHAAMSVVIAQRNMTAQQAFSYGVVNEVVVREDLMKTVDQYVEDILVGGPLSVRACKEAAIKGAHLSIQEAMETPFPGQVALGTSQDAVEGPLAFSEKRKPTWTGK